MALYKVPCPLTLTLPLSVYSTAHAYSHSEIIDIEHVQRTCIKTDAKSETSANRANNVVVIVSGSG